MRIARLALALVLGAVPAAADEPAPSFGTLGVSAGLDYRRGDYDLERDTEIWYAPFTLKLLLDDFAPTPWRNDQIELGVTLPWVEIHGPSLVAQGAGRVDAAGSDPGDPTGRRRTRDRGLGDLVARVTYLWYPTRPLPLPALELSTKVRFPTGDQSRGLGTGAFETTTQLDLYRSFGRVTPLGTIGYRFFGQSRDFRLRDGPLASLGFALRGPRWLSGGVFFDWRRSATRGVDDPLELMPYLSIRPNRRVAIQPYGVVGFSDGSADYGAGLQLSTRLTLRRPR